MSKELEALEQLKYYNTLANDDFDMTKELSIIESALKRLEEIDKAYQTLPIEFRTVVKAFEVIKRDYYLVAECLDKYNSFEEMQKDLGKQCPIKTQEEYELLKKVLL